MSSEEISVLQSHSLENGINPQLVFQDDALRFNCAATPQRRVGDSVPKTQKLSGFMEDRFLVPHGSDFRRSLYNDGRDLADPHETRNWNGNRSATTPSGDGSQDDDEDEVDDDDGVDEGDAEVDELVVVDGGGKVNNGDRTSNGKDQMGNEKENHLHHSPFGASAIFGQNREVMLKDSSIRQQNVSSSSTKACPSENQCQQGSYRNQNAISAVEPDIDAYYSQYLKGSEGPASGQRGLAADNGCGFSGRKDFSCLNEPGESLRAIFSDPVTGALMDDAMILPCGHSFGSGGIQHVLGMKACYICSQPISEDLVAPNLSLRDAVHAFHREEEFYRSSKRRRDRFDQDKSGDGDLSLMDPPRGRGVQFPFAVTDRVIIKGNKRTPQRFVGREAIVTTQCLNGWYVVKTLDNAESVKLQYRSLDKVNDPSSKPMSSKMTPNWH